MPRLKMLVEVRKNGDYFMKAPVDELVEFFDMNTSVVSRKAAIGGVINLRGDKYMLRYTDEMVPRKNPYEKPAPRKKPDISVSDVVRMGRANGLSYGYQSALMMAAKERHGK